MIKRLVWFLGGVVAGVTGYVWARNRVEEIRGSVTPASIARWTIDSSVSVLRRLRTAFATGRERSSGEITVPVVGTSAGARHHIATRPRRTHG